MPPISIPLISGAASFANTIKNALTPTVPANKQLGLMSTVGYPGTGTPTTTPSQYVKAPAYNPAAPTATAQTPQTPQNEALKALEAENARLDRLYQQSVNAQPRLAYYDTGAAAAKALNAATAAQTPVYVNKLNNYLEGLAIKRAAAQRQSEQTIQDAQTTLSDALVASGTSRTRTAEDVANKIGDISTQQDQYQTDSGQSFDSARRALGVDLATSGLGTKGIGGQEASNLQNAQTTESKRQAQQFQEQKQNAELFKTRTFEDLATSDAIKQRETGKTTERAKVNLEDYLKTSALEEQANRDAIEQERQSAILQDQNNRIKVGSREFIAQLARSGARPQDIALAAQVYGA